MKKTYLLTLLVYISLSVCVFAIDGDLNNLQAFSHLASQWLTDADGFELLHYNYFPGNVSDSVSDITIDLSGNVYLTGTSKVHSEDDDDILTIKYDPNGVEIWTARYDGNDGGYDYPDAIVVDQSHNIYIAGSTSVSGQSYNYVTLKYDSQGQQLWAKTYGYAYAHEDYVRNLCVDGAGNVFVTGMVRTASSSYDFLTIKYSSNGTQLWTAQYNGSANSVDEGKFIQADEAGNVYVTGQSYGIGTSGDCVTIKYDPNGVQLWTGRLSDIDSFGYPCGQDLDDMGNVIVTGRGLMGGDPNQKMVTVKYDSAGQLLWTKANGDEAYGRAQMIDTDGNIYVCGIQYHWPLRRSHTYKYDPDGVVLWSDIYEFESYDDIPEAFMKKDVNDNIIIAITPGTEESIIIKYDSQGNRIWTGTSGCDIKGRYQGLAVGPAGNIHVTGDSDSDTMGQDYTVIKYDADGQSLWQQYYQGGEYAFSPNTAIRNCQNTLYFGGSGLFGRYTATIAAYDTQGHIQWMGYTECSEPKAITRDADGNLFIGGHHRTGSYPSTPFVNYYAIAKFNDTGQLQWTKKYSSPSGYNYGYDIAVDSLGNSYITGNSSSDYLTVKYDPNGLFCWERRFDGADNDSDYARSITVDCQDSILVTGDSESGGSKHLVTIKYDPDGTVLWTREHPEAYLNCASVKTDSANNVYVCGYRQESDFATVLVKYDPNGVEQWAAKEDFSGYSSGTLRDMVLLDDGSIYVAGERYSDQTQSDILLMKYSPNGQLLWQEIYAHSAVTHDLLSSFAVGDADNVFLSVHSIVYDPYEESLVVLKYNTDGERIYSDQKVFTGQEMAYMGGQVVLDSDNNAHVLGMLLDNVNLTERTVYMKYPEFYSCHPQIEYDPDKDCTCGMNDLLLLCENWLQ